MKSSSFLLTIILLYISTIAYSQNNSENNGKTQSIFERLTSDLKEFKPDTAAAPNDKITRKIIELRKLKGGFNINEAVEYKLAEDKQKAQIPSADFEKFSTYITKGDGRKWLDNSIIAIYRQYFTYKELKQLIRFYKTAGGRKISTEFPFIMMKSLAAGEAIKSMYEEFEKNKK